MDVSVMIENIKFNYRVATIIRNGDKILLHKSKKDDFYAIPGGRIMVGEDSETALKREFVEEIGANIFIKKYLGTIENFFEYNGKKLSQTQYRRHWTALMETLSMSHTPHECRHTFRSRLDSAGANKVCIDHLMGHVSQGTGERIYTHKTIEELKSNLALITN